MTTDQLQALNKDGSADNDLDIYNDTLITQNQFAEEVERMQAGSDFSPRIKQLARLSNVTRNLVYAQAVGKGVDLDSLLMKDEVQVLNLPTLCLVPVICKPWALVLVVLHIWLQTFSRNHPGMVCAAGVGCLIPQQVKWMGLAVTVV